MLGRRRTAQGELQDALREVGGGRAFSDAEVQVMRGPSKGRSVHGRFSRCFVLMRPLPTAGQLLAGSAPRGGNAGGPARRIAALLRFRHSATWMGVLNGQDVAKGFTRGGGGLAMRAKLPCQHGVRRAGCGFLGLAGGRRDGRAKVRMVHREGRASRLRHPARGNGTGSRWPGVLRLRRQTKKVGQGRRFSSPALIGMHWFVLSPQARRIPAAARGGGLVGRASVRAHRSSHDPERRGQESDH
jgi:hypothetical protein